MRTQTEPLFKGMGHRRRRDEDAMEVAGCRAAAEFRVDEPNQRHGASTGSKSFGRWRMKMLGVTIGMVSKKRRSIGSVLYSSSG
jgi:hypothetical protein